ncbi:hypothetical protein PPL_00965 [Heterostelium album PN500]|uniref:Uncharacterized protein n=1 Tax=Heterostelium pallidum (strain ATCC 26659 / Pp 5 / PN500) TaxID=670386 RepID=D3AXQ8_HETP5|nr:hypothetical protein PPL_00965 [Heterostelium album PN500]EFA85735.1 hypothetical protein PPL_00965 [Heterostelium album PN500]|eukprot:XP_020437841.1 hypothetical protein PPL_00965 [Heterostelium album PN500]
MGGKKKKSNNKTKKTSSTSTSSTSSNTLQKIEKENVTFASSTTSASASTQQPKVEKEKVSPTSYMNLDSVDLQKHEEKIMRQIKEIEAFTRVVDISSMEYDDTVALKKIKERIVQLKELKRLIENQKSFKDIQQRIQKLSFDQPPIQLPKSQLFQSNQQANEQQQTKKDESPKIKTTTTTTTTNTSTKTTNKNTNNSKNQIMINGLTVARRYQSDILAKYYTMLTGNQWNDTPEFATQLKSLLPNLKMKDIPQKYHISLNSGDRSSWESPLLHHVFELLISSLKSKQQQQLDETIEQSLEFSSLVSSLYNHYIINPTVTNSDEFEDDIKEFLETLSSIGVPSDVIECIRLSTPITNSTDSQAKELISKTKLSIGKHDYVKAVEFCNQGIAVTGLSIESQAKLYFYRGYANEMYRLQSRQSAVSREVILLDLSRTSAIKPKWKCTKFLMALIYFHDDKFEEAKAAAEACLVLDTHYQKAKDLLVFINFDLGMISNGYKDDFQKYDAQQYKDLLKGRNINPSFLSQAFLREDKNVENGFRYLYGYDGTTKDIAKSLKYFQSSPNNAEALLYSGILLQQGKTVRRNFKDAFDCFVRSKDVGGLESHTQIAKCYRYGLGVDIDISKAQATLEERIKMTNKLSVNTVMDQDLTELGELYLQNQDPDDYCKAAQYFQTAASSGYPDAMFYLGYVYLNGFGVEKDLEAAEMWLKRAAKLSHPRALNALEAVKYQKTMSKLPDAAQDMFNKLQSIKFEESILPHY